jgi:hypothetical protein
MPDDQVELTLETIVSLIQVKQSEATLERPLLPYTCPQSPFCVFFSVSLPAKAIRRDIRCRALSLKPLVASC